MAGQLALTRIADPILTNIARGYSNAELIGDKLFPVVEVTKEGGKIPVFGKDAFKLWNTARALRAGSNEGEGVLPTTVPYTTTEHDFQIPLDYRELAEAELLNLEAYTTLGVQSQLALGKEKEQADLAQDLANYSSDNKVTLTDDFFNEDAIDFIKELLDYKLALASLIGKDPNNMVIGGDCWRHLVMHPKFRGLLTVGSTTALDLSVMPTLQRLSDILEIPNIYIGKAIYSDGGTFEKIWGNNIILAYVAPPSGIAQNPYEPAFGYTLRKKNHPVVDKYMTEGGKVTKIRNTDNYDIKIVGADGAFIINNPIDPTAYAPS